MIWFMFAFGIYIGGVIPMLAIGAMAHADGEFGSRESEEVASGVIFHTIVWPYTLWLWSQGRDLRR